MLFPILTSLCSFSGFQRTNGLAYALARRLFQTEKQMTGNFPGQPPPPPSSPDSVEAQVMGECQKEGSSSVHALMSQASSGGDSVKSSMVSCKGSESIKLQLFSDEICEHELNIADQLAPSPPGMSMKSDWDGTLTKDWTTIASVTAAGVTVNEQMKLVKIEGCPSVGTGAPW